MYRAIVINTKDPQGLGRIQVKAPDISGEQVLGWALPSVPPNNFSKKIGSALPPVGAMVWIQFERGDASSPIWTGRFFTSPTETPPALRSS